MSPKDQPLHTALRWVSFYSLSSLLVHQVSLDPKDMCWALTGCAPRDQGHGRTHGQVCCSQSLAMCLSKEGPCQCCVVVEGSSCPYIELQLLG